MWTKKACDCERELDDAIYEKDQAENRARQDRSAARQQLEQARSAAHEEYCLLEEEHANLHSAYAAVSDWLSQCRVALSSAHAALVSHPGGDNRSEEDIEAAKAALSGMKEKEEFIPVFGMPGVSISRSGVIKASSDLILKMKAAGLLEED